MFLTLRVAMIECLNIRRGRLPILLRLRGVFTEVSQKFHVLSRTFNFSKIGLLKVTGCAANGR